MLAMFSALFCALCMFQYIYFHKKYEKGNIISLILQMWKLRHRVSYGVCIRLYTQVVTKQTFNPEWLCTKATPKYYPRKAARRCLTNRKKFQWLSSQGNLHLWKINFFPVDLSRLLPEMEVVLFIDKKRKNLFPGEREASRKIQSSGYPN